MTQRPGCNRLATSVKTLTTGSQATADFTPEVERPTPLPDRSRIISEFSMMRTGWTGTRIRTEVFAIQSGVTEKVWLDRAATFKEAAARSVFTDRFTLLAIKLSARWTSFRAAPDKSLPDANPIAPSVATPANVPRTRFEK